MFSFNRKLSNKEILIKEFTKVILLLSKKYNIKESFLNLEKLIENALIRVRQEQNRLFWGDVKCPS